MSKYEFYDAEFYCNIRKWGNDFEIVFKYYNLGTNISFSEAGYFYVSYPMVKNTNKIAKTFDQRVVYCGYEDDFHLEKLLETIYETLKEHSELVKGPIPKNRRKLYAILSAFFFLLLFIVFGCMILYGVLTNTRFVKHPQGIPRGCFFARYRTKKICISAIFDTIAYNLKNLNVQIVCQAGISVDGPTATLEEFAVLQRKIAEILQQPVR